MFCLRKIKYYFVSQSTKERVQLFLWILKKETKQKQKKKEKSRVGGKYTTFKMEIREIFIKTNQNI